jgi:ppGpp synthetase/RelA/SpoT-type nucleotidyltranferase
MPAKKGIAPVPVYAPEFQPGNIFDTFDKFHAHPSIAPFIAKYRHDAELAKAARLKMLSDFKDLNDAYANAHNKESLITSFDSRVKGESSFFEKLFDLCRDNCPITGLTEPLVDEQYSSIHDLCGGRFSCAYFSDVKPVLYDSVRPYLNALDYETDLEKTDPIYKDKDLLKDGDERGYRSYHFYIRVPTVWNIYGNIEMCLAEIQARTELQHVWSVKSHDLMYKPLNGGKKITDDIILEDMKGISDNLSFADGFLDRIRSRVRMLNDEDK